MKNKPSGFQTTLPERAAYPMFSFGQNIVYLLVTGYLSLYCTDYLYIPALTVSAVFLVAKIWDAVNDTLFGLIVDKVKFRHNKFKPWLRISLFLIPAMTILMFHINPGLPLPARVASLAGAYFLWDLVYTVSDVPIFSMVTAVTGNVQERSTLLSYGSIASVICGIIFILGLVPRLETLGFGTISLIAAGLSLLGMLPFTILSKERNRVAVVKEEKSSIKELLAYVRGNKYLWIFYAYFIGSNLFSIGVTLGSYIYIYCLGSLSWLSVFTAFGVIPMVIVYLLMPVLTKKFERMLLYKISVISSLVLGVALFFVGYHNIVLFGIITVVRTVLATPASMLSFTFTMDCVEYGHYKTGVRKEGITFAVQSFANKFATAVSGALALLILGLTGYDGALEVQSAHTLSMMWNAYCLVPVFGILVMLPILFRYKLKGSDVQIMADVNAGKLSKEEGERMLSGKL